MWRHNSSAPGGRRDFFEAVRVGDWWGVFFFPVMMAEEQGGSGKRPKGILKHKSEDKHQ